MTAIYFRNGTYDGERLPSWYTYLGNGVFETLRVRKQVRDGKAQLLIAALNLHLNRLEQGNQIIDSKVYNRAEITERIERALALFDWNNVSDAILRIILQTEDWFLSVEPWQPVWENYEQGITAVSVQVERPLPEIKSCSALPSVYARSEAYSRGADEALLVDRDGIVREGAWSNFFWIDQENRLVTPATRILPGVTRQLVLDQARELDISTLERDVPLTEIIETAREAFITQSTHGIVPVVKIDDCVLSRGAPGTTIQCLKSKYEEITRSSPYSFKKQANNRSK